MRSPNWSDVAAWMCCRDEHLEEDVRAVRVILASKLEQRLTSRFWKEVLFDATEFPKKYCTRFVSEGVLKLVPLCKLPKVERLRQLHAMTSSLNGLDVDRNELQHDHVWSRRWLKVELSHDGADLMKTLRDHAWACTLTKAEHKAVGTKPEGWDKYHIAGVGVFDILEGAWVAHH